MLCLSAFQGTHSRTHRQRHSTAPHSVHTTVRHKNSSYQAALERTFLAHTQNTHTTLHARTRLAHVATTLPAASTVHRKVRQRPLLNQCRPAAVDSLHRAKPPRARRPDLRIKNWFGGRWEVSASVLSIIRRRRTLRPFLKHSYKRARALSLPLLALITYLIPHTACKARSRPLKRQTHLPSVPDLHLPASKARNNPSADLTPTHGPKLRQEPPSSMPHIDNSPSRRR